MKIVRYAAVGGTAAAVDFFIFAVFAKFLDFNYLVVGAAGFVIATAVNYFLSIRFVFESGVRFGFQKEILLVFLISFIGLGLNQVVLYLGIGILGWEMLFIKLCATASVFFWNFGARSQFIFKPLEKAQKQQEGLSSASTE
jgi:putative flippase GtrA